MIDEIPDEVIDNIEDSFEIIPFHNSSILLHQYIKHDMSAWSIYIQKTQKTQLDCVRKTFNIEGFITSLVCIIWDGEKWI